MRGVVFVGVGCDGCDFNSGGFDRVCACSGCAGIGTDCVVGGGGCVAAGRATVGRVSAVGVCFAPLRELRWGTGSTFEDFFV